MANKTTIQLKESGDQLSAVEFNQLNTNFNNAVDEINASTTKLNSFLFRNKDTSPAVRTAVELSDISIIHVSDTHGKIQCIKNAGELKNKYNSVAHPVIFVNTGDVAELGPTVPNWAQYLSYVQDYEIYHVLGQHEVGYTDVIADCWTHAQAFTNLISPNLIKWDLVGLTTNYYYKDFASKLRLIVLYQYNAPLDMNPVDATKYKYSRATLWYGQDQIDWLCNTLNSTPDGYGVVIAMHQHDSGVLPAGDSSPFYKSFGPPQNKVIEGHIIRDIVENWINKTAINITYTSSIGLELIVNFDFSGAHGLFLHYMSGDAHVDACGYVDSTTQRAITISSPHSPYDVATTYENEKEYDVINVYGYDRTAKKISMVRVGANCSKTMQDRRFQLISIVE